MKLIKYIKDLGMILNFLASDFKRKPILQVKLFGWLIYILLSSFVIWLSKCSVRAYPILYYSRLIFFRIFDCLTFYHYEIRKKISFERR